MDTSMLDRSDDDIRKEVLEIASEETGIRNFKSTGILRSMWEVLARVVGQIYRKFLTPIYHETNIDTADGSWLDQWGLLLGVTRKRATKTEGVVKLTAYQPGTLEAGLWIVFTGTDYRFRVVESVDFVAGENNIKVEAEFEGADYNVAAGPGSLTKVVSGTGPVDFPEDWITTLGTDTESDEDYRLRIKERWSAEGQGNSPSSYVYTAMSVPGVADVTVIRTPRGYGTVDVIIVAENGLPSEELLEEVYEAIEGEGLICNDLQVKAPKEKAASISVEYSGDADETEIEEAIRQHVYSIGIGGRLEVRNIYEVLEQFELDTAEVLSPDRDVQAKADEMIIATVSAEKKTE